jgi:hypothetical protein
MTGKESSTVPHPHELQGWIVDSSRPDVLRQALEQALDYRGDITIARKSSAAAIEGYIFDIKAAKAAGGEITVRLVPRNSDEHIAIPFSDIASLSFTGKDTASGKSFETWIKKYAEKKLAGEKANIESESLDEHD